MNSFKPPRLATWLLEHLATGPNKEAVAGDLLEQFSQGRSAAWYWRQALAAILVGFWKGLGSQWIAIAFATSCTWAVNVLMGDGSWLGELLESAINWAFWLPWPLSIIYQFGFGMMLYVVIVSVALGVYLSVVGRLALRRFCHGFFAGMVFLFVSYVLLFMGASLHLSFLGLFAHWLPLFCGLMVAFWTALPPADAARHARTPA